MLLLPSQYIKCPCGNLIPPKLKHKGGPQKKYCSRKCSSEFWQKQNPEKANAKSLRHYWKHRESRLELGRKWRANNREKHRKLVRDWRAARRWAKYGLSNEQFDTLIKQQSGKCAVCQSIPNDGLKVDHCHNTGIVRGLLCNPCNKALGFLRDDPVRIRELAEYIERNSLFVRRAA